MRSLPLASIVILLFALISIAQVDGIRTATGMPLSVDARIVYGRIAIEGLESGAKLPRINVILLDRRLQSNRTTIDRDGYFYFRDVSADGGTVVVEIEGTEVARQTLMTVGPKQQRMDFYVTVPLKHGQAKPGTISAKNLYDRGKDNASLMSKAIEAIENKKPEKAVPHLTKILETDPADHPAWAILGAAYSATGDAENAEKAFLKALKIRPDSAPALTSLGSFYMSQKRFEPAIEALEKAIVAEPSSASAFRLLGEVYLQVRKGSKAILALNEAIRLQPKEMADCHMLLAKLYDIAGARHLASAEFTLLLEKVPDHPEKNKIKQYIKDNPPQPDK
ncbi:MAG: tetratricopeptide repeat protein [Acidobacteria bacterium]|nr:tetratricopeptide repeat protein [Acidobacteriota bacterium]